MGNPITEPLSRLYDRWRTARALAQLDAHLLEDIGQKAARSPFDDITIARFGYFLGRTNK
ncbi:MAG: DUF1127 domain-containing protein [Alphaproteobacteria bacterium]|nr:DUF1127 domain-containing protein [Alphaproteobacteria bacterium]